ncbi:hypothetical protein MTR67_023302 [Solanum verrucosum]|uniref:AP complex mu/sigma subunit domain-containing protein n=1 Tax=Solanum verrucosum TaxID=315347 RepID=A0AAF0TR93_SOLVR|nr:hypothetical protein MTR67_023302 [Solanum verrucosum]
MKVTSFSHSLFMFELPSRQEAATVKDGEWFWNSRRLTVNWGSPIMGDDTDMLEKTFDEEEVHSIIQSHALDKALGSDGFTMNELAILEFIHLLVETMDRHFGNVCELDIMFHLEKAHFMLEEMVMNGCIVETSKANILTPIQLMDKAS